MFLPRSVINTRKKISFIHKNEVKILLELKETKQNPAKKKKWQQTTQKIHHLQSLKTSSCFATKIKHPIYNMIQPKPAKMALQNTHSPATPDTHSINACKKIIELINEFAPSRYVENQLAGLYVAAFP